jgi:cell division protein FtsL
MNDFRLDIEPKIKSGFQTPDNYFENFSEKIMQQLPEQEPKVISIFQRRRTWIMAVAAVLVLALFIPVYNQFSTKTTELDETTLENYITDQSDINQYDLVTLLETEDIENMKVAVNIEDETIEDILSTNSNLEHIITE